MKYKVGDKILIEGEIVQVDDTDEMHPYRVTMKNASRWYREEDITGLQCPFKQGEIIEVRDGENRKWEKYRFIAYAEDEKHPYIINQDNNFHACDTYFGYKYARAIPEKEEYNLKLTLKGEEIDPGDISDESWNNLRKKDK